MSGPPPSAPRGAVLRLVGAPLAVAALFLVYLWNSVPHLSNFLHSDREFTGWSGAIARRLLGGGTPYVDWVVPVPPGSFALLALVQRVAGRALLSQELWLVGLCQLAMGAIGYSFARRFASPRVALGVFVVSLALLAQSLKECAYDQTSLVPAWLSLLAATDAMLSDAAGQRARRWAAAGALAAASLWFKQSTATGMLGGLLLAVSYQAAAGPDRGRAAARDAAALAGGALLGLAATLAAVAALGAPLPDFLRAVSVDGPALKGGLPTLLGNLLRFVGLFDVVRVTLVPALLVVLLGVAAHRRGGSFHLGRQPTGDEDSPPGGRAAVLAVALAAFGLASLILAGRIPRPAHSVAAHLDIVRFAPAYGFAFGAVCFASQLRPAPGTDAAAARRGHALNGALLAATAASLVYGTSFVQFSPFYYNEPFIPVVVTCLLVVGERTGRAWVLPALVIVGVLPLFGTKLERAASTRIRVTSGTWEGLRVNERGTEVLRAATRARDRAGKNGRVLVLPEDLQLSELIARPRPALRGAVVFVDQYPERLLAGDRASLLRDPPEVIVIHPRSRADWKSMFATWSERSAAERLIDWVLDDLLPERYVLDASFPTIYFWDSGRIDVYVRRDAR